MIKNLSKKSIDSLLQGEEWRDIEYMINSNQELDLLFFLGYNDEIFIDKILGKCSYRHTQYTNIGYAIKDEYKIQVAQNRLEEYENGDSIVNEGVDYASNCDYNNFDSEGDHRLCYHKYDYEQITIDYNNFIEDYSRLERYYNGDFSNEDIDRTSQQSYEDIMSVQEPYIPEER